MMENLTISFLDPTTPHLPPFHCKQPGPKGAHNVLSGAKIDGFISAYFDEEQSNNEDIICQVTFEGKQAWTCIIVVSLLTA